MSRQIKEMRHEKFNFPYFASLSKVFHICVKDFAHPDLGLAVFLGLC
jgi:hypothetical protein